MEGSPQRLRKPSCARRMTRGEVSVIADLEHLRECHLVTIDPHAGDVRYRMLEPVREYAVEQLAARMKCPLPADATRSGAQRSPRRPSAGCGTNGSPARSMPSNGSWPTSGPRCRVPRHSDQGDDDLYLRIAVAMRHYWDMRGPLAEAHRHYRELLSRVPRTTPKLVYPLLNLALDASCAVRTSSRPRRCSTRRSSWRPAMPTRSRAISGAERCEPRCVRQGSGIGGRGARGTVSHGRVNRESAGSWRAR